MDIGVFTTLTAESMPITTLARAIEERGVESLWLGEHTHLPVASATEGYHDTAMLERTKGFPASIILLTAAAAVTATLRIGTSVCLVAQHDPLVLAKELATLDVISAGRFEFGCGYGWNQAEMRNHGFEPGDRRAVFREKLEALRRLWTEDVTHYDGTYVSFSDSWSEPKPIQRPHPPILLGAPARPRAIRDLVDLADGWLPSAYFAIETFDRDLATIRHAWQEAGRDPAGPRLTVLESGTAAVGVTLDEFTDRRPPLERLVRYAELGAQRVVIGIPAEEPAMTLQMLDHVASLADALAP